MNNNTTNNSIAMPEDVLPMREKLKDRLLELMPEPQRVITAVDGLNLLRRDAPTLGESCFYRPLIGFTIQGRKHSMVASNEYDYGDGQYLVTGVDMPSINEIREASSDRPYLAISLTLDRYLITQLATEVPPPAHSTPDVSSGVGVDNPTPELMDSVHRLLALLDTPERIPVLAPLIIREIHYHILTGPLGGCPRSISTLGSQSNQVAQAITWLRNNFREPLIIENLAGLVNMAESTFHRHFRKVTTISPLQFQKRLRLFEAQRLMLAENMDASTAALDVGYESATQFNREYKREFGEPPHRDVNRMRAAGVGPGLPF